MANTKLNDFGDLYQLKGTIQYAATVIKGNNLSKTELKTIRKGFVANVKGVFMSERIDLEASQTTKTDALLKLFSDEAENCETEFKGFVKWMLAKIATAIDDLRKELDA